MKNLAIWVCVAFLSATFFVGPSPAATKFKHKPVGGYYMNEDGSFRSTPGSCGIFEILLAMTPDGTTAEIMDHCRHVRDVPCKWYKVASSGLDSGRRNTCLDQYKKTDPSAPSPVH